MKIKEKIRKLFGTESESDEPERSRQLSATTVSESEKEKEESDILILNDPCELLNSPERETTTDTPKVDDQLFEGQCLDIEIDPNIEKYVTLSPIKDLPKTPGKEFCLSPRKSIVVECKNVQKIKKKPALSNIKITVSQSVSHSHSHSINYKNIDLKGIRHTHTKPNISYADNSVRQLAHSNRTISFASQSHEASSHHLSHLNASLPSRTLSAQSNTHTLTLSNQNQPRSKPLSQAHAQYQSHSHQASTHSSLNTPSHYQYAYNETNYNSQPHYQHLNYQHSHAYTSTPAQSYYQHTQAPQAFRTHPYQQFTRTLTQTINRPIIERERQNTRVISLENKHVPKGIHLAIAVSKSKFYSKNALKKITRKLANEF